MYVCAGGGHLCEQCVENEKDRIESVDVDCPDDDQWRIVGTHECTGQVCDHCGRGGNKEMDVEAVEEHIGMNMLQAWEMVVDYFGTQADDDEAYPDAIAVAHLARSIVAVTLDDAATAMHSDGSEDIAIANDVGKDVAKAIGDHLHGRLAGVTAVCGSYLVEVSERGGEVVVTARVPRSLLDS